MDPIVSLLLGLVIGVALGIGGGLLIARTRSTAVDPATEVVRAAMNEAAQAIRQDLSHQRSELMSVLQNEGQASRQTSADLKKDVVDQLIAVREGNNERLERIRTTVEGSLKENSEKVVELTQSNADRSAELQRAVREELDKLRQGNETKLEQMRETVDEKLQSTLEKRLGESFSIVSSRLVEVQKGLGEMQTLAQDVGGLKRVLTNVKNRGTWGEVQLQRQLEDILTPEQFDSNVAIKPGSAERVEFAVRLPGQGDDGGQIYLPIDSKFPHEDFDRLLEAQELGDKSAVDTAAVLLERAIIEQAKTIAKKYIEPPYSTDFAIMYLPTEGLFAEVARRPGLLERLQTMHRITVTGPTTLASLLRSLQLGFRTLAIEKRSSEVWQILGTVKREFEKYGQVWEKLQKQLGTAQKTVDEVTVRTRAVQRSLRGVEASPSGSPSELTTSDASSVEDELAALDDLLGVARDQIVDTSPSDGAVTRSADTA